MWICLRHWQEHQKLALRRARDSVSASLANGSRIAVGALHTLKHVGPWVVRQLKEFSDDPPTRASPAPTPDSFSWWYLNSRGQQVSKRVEAQSRNGQFRVAILHSSGMMERAWLPSDRAPETC